MTKPSLTNVYNVPEKFSQMPYKISDTLPDVFSTHKNQGAEHAAWLDNKYLKIK